MPESFHTNIKALMHLSGHEAPSVDIGFCHGIGYSGIQSFLSGEAVFNVYLHRVQAINVEAPDKLWSTYRAYMVVQHGQYKQTMRFRTGARDVDLSDYAHQQHAQRLNAQQLHDYEQMVAQLPGPEVSLSEETRLSILDLDAYLESVCIAQGRLNTRDPEVRSAIKTLRGSVQYSYAAIQALTESAHTAKAAKDDKPRMLCQLTQLEDFDTLKSTLLDLEEQQDAALPGQPFALLLHFKGIKADKSVYKHAIALLAMQGTWRILDSNNINLLFRKVDAASILNAIRRISSSSEGKKIKTITAHLFNRANTAYMNSLAVTMGNMVYRTLRDKKSKRELKTIGDHYRFFYDALDSVDAAFAPALFTRLHRLCTNDYARLTLSLIQPRAIFSTHTRIQLIEALHTVQQTQAGISYGHIYITMTALIAKLPPDEASHYLARQYPQLPPTQKGYFIKQLLLAMDTYASPETAEAMANTLMILNIDWAVKVGHTPLCFYVADLPDHLSHQLVIHIHQQNTLLLGSASVTSTQDTILHYTAQQGNIRLFHTFREIGLDCGRLNVARRSVYHTIAICPTLSDEVRLAMLDAIDIEALKLGQDSLLRTPLHYAAHNVYLIGRLVHPDNVNARDHRRNTPLHQAAVNPNATPDAVQALLEHGATPDLSNADQKTPADIASAQGHHDVVPLLTPTTSKKRRLAQ